MRLERTHVRRRLPVTFVVALLGAALLLVGARFGSTFPEPVTATPRGPGAQGGPRSAQQAPGAARQQTAHRLADSPNATPPVRGLRRALSAGVGPGGFDQVNDEGGSFLPTLGAGSPDAVRARVDARRGVRVARGLWDVDWPPGSTVCFGASFYLPPGFFSDLQDSVDLLRWDNWDARPERTDHGGLTLWQDQGLRLFRETLDEGNYQILLGPYRVREGRWFRLVVEQRLSNAAASAESAVWKDKRLLGWSTTPNAFGRAVLAIRYGIVAVNIDKQRKGLSLLMSGAFERSGACDEADLA